MRYLAILVGGFFLLAFLGTHTPMRYPVSTLFAADAPTQPPPAVPAPVAEKPVAEKPLSAMTIGELYKYDGRLDERQERLINEVTNTLSLINARKKEIADELVKRGHPAEVKGK